MNHWISAFDRRLARVVLGAALAAVSVTAVAAAEYHGVASGDGYIMMVDKSSIYQNGDFTRGWVVTLYADPNDNQDPIESALSEFDCAQHRWRAISYASRDAQGAVVLSFDNDDLSWSNVQPSTVGEDIQTAICSPASMTDEPLPTDSLTDLREAYLKTQEDK